MSPAELHEFRNELLVLANRAEEVRSELTTEQMQSAPDGSLVDPYRPAELHNQAAGEVVSGASIASMLEETDPAALRSGTVTFRVLRHLQRLDEGVIGLARPLDVPVGSAEDRNSRATAA